MTNSENKNCPEDNPSWSEIFGKARSKIKKTFEKKESGQEKGKFFDSKIWKNLKKRIRDLFEDGSENVKAEKNQESDPDLDKAEKEEKSQAGLDQGSNQKKDKPERDQDSSKSNQEKKEDQDFSDFGQKEKTLSWKERLIGSWRQRYKKHIKADDEEYPEMPKSRFEEVSIKNKIGKGKEIDCLVDYFGRTNREPFQRSGNGESQDMKEIKKVVNSINPNLKKSLKTFLKIFGKEVDPTFGHAGVKPLELITDLEMLDGKITTLGVASSQDFEADVAARLNKKKNFFDKFKIGSEEVLKFFTETWGRKFVSGVAILGTSLIFHPAVLFAFLTPAARKLILTMGDHHFGKKPILIQSRRVSGLLRRKEFADLKAFSVGQGHRIKIDKLPSKIRWLEIREGWCFLPSVKKNNSNQDLHYNNKVIIGQDKKSIKPEIIVKSPAIWEAFLSQIGENNPQDLPIKDKKFNRDIAPKCEKLFLPPEIEIVRGLNLENVKDFFANNLKKIEGELKIPSNDVLKQFPNGMILVDELIDPEKLDQDLLKRKIKN